MMFTPSRREAHLVRSLLARRECPKEEIVVGMKHSETLPWLRSDDADEIVAKRGLANPFDRSMSSASLAYAA
jgi:hypothetical protein